ncbi:LexA family transcriptional regulator [Pantoea sp. CCBC3-3-1]|uniref:LexA family protein n=1 Tax=Pantoea sp. CCBC3-3-1 TaxID=2490851 RepID=UPI0011BE56D2|nr:S24 family peptidase [Pantoea sp. CCBC3-3-1]
MNMKWNELAKIRMRDMGIGQEKLSEHLGITKGAVSHWLNARREPSLEDIAKIMRYLGLKAFVVNHDGTIAPAGSISNVDGYKPYTPGKRYPVLSKVQAAAWAEACEPDNLKDIDLWLESDASTQGEGFWLEADGDSMTAPMGLSIPEGTFVLFDTGREPINGSLVVAKLVDDNPATFKKLVVDGSQKYLRGLNPQWPMVPINGNCRIIGVAIETKMRLV